MAHADPGVVPGLSASPLPSPGLTEEPEHPDAPYCDPRYVYRAKNPTNAHQGVGVGQASYNGTSKTIKSIFSSKQSGPSA
ncbi:hypothetical protein [Acrocarpospora corrugata]|uniref:hypothetical protein n=1 Tax=Acrocarpospora corrugata TaxID=35763 RepID=UPI0012D2FA44|nr:hypothetical protein [Acrocarpospora corrugata]